MTEIESLKKHATKEEINKLDLETFHPEHESLCIYGQMTGNCKSKRAKVLMDKSCTRVWDVGCGELSLSLFGDTFTKVKSLINGEYTGQMWIGNHRNYSYLSALEGYIALKGANIKGIIQYLKGEIDSLKL